MSCTRSEPYTDEGFDNLTADLNSAIFDSSKVRALVENATEECVIITTINPQGTKNFAMFLCDSSGVISRDSNSLTAKFPCPNECSLFEILVYDQKLGKTRAPNVFCREHVLRIINQNPPTSIPQSIKGIAFHYFEYNGNDGLAMYLTNSKKQIPPGVYAHLRFNTNHYEVYRAV